MGARWYNPSSATFGSRDSVNYSRGDSILANRYTYGAGAPLDYDDPDGHWPNWKKIGSAISSGWNTVKTAVVSAASTAWNYTVSAARWVGSAIKNTAVALYHKTGLDRVVNKVREGYHALRSGNFKDWAKQQARAAAKRLNEVRKAVTAKAKSAVKAAIKYTPIPAVLAAAKPLIKMAGKVIQSAAKIAPALVQMTVQAVTDPTKFAANLYNKAVESVGAVVETVSKAADAVGQFVQEHQDAIIEGLAIVGGIAAGLACTAATAGAGAVACMVGAAALINLAKDAAQGNINSFGDAFKSAAVGGLQGLVGAGAGAIGGKVAGAVVGKLGSFGGKVGGRMLEGAVDGAVSDGVEQFVTTGKVDLSGVAMSAGIGAVTGGFGRGGSGCAGRNSFAGDTGVLMADGGRKQISLVMVGDVVVATDPTTGRTEKRHVTDVIVGAGEKRLVEITVDTDAGPSKIVATDEHPFWVTDLKDWVFPKNLRPGYRFETGDHRAATVHSTRAWTEHTTVYNLTVDELHTYYVAAGDTPVLVHNCTGPNCGCNRAGNAAEWVNEGGPLNTTPPRYGMSPSAYRYQSGAAGARSDLATRTSSQPLLRMPGADGQDVTAKFDGAYGNEVIDRKTKMTTFPEKVDQAQRQAGTAAYHGLTPVYEFPTQQRADEARAILDAWGITSIVTRQAN